MTDRLNILIVDDRPENLLALESILESPDLNIVRANSARKPLAHARPRFRPGSAGRANAGNGRIRDRRTHARNTRTRHIPIIFVTANHTEPHNVFRGYDSGAVDYLFNP
jgi:CheY-like chemotaxis protein